MCEHDDDRAVVCRRDGGAVYGHEEGSKGYCEWRGSLDGWMAVIDGHKSVLDEEYLRVLDSPECL